MAPKQQPPPIHGGDHVPGGPDPIPGLETGGELPYITLYRKTSSRAQTLSSGLAALMEWDFYRTNDTDGLFVLVEAINTSPPVSGETAATDHAQYVRVTEQGVYAVSFGIRLPGTPTNRVELAIDLEDYTTGSDRSPAVLQHHEAHMGAGVQARGSVAGHFTVGVVSDDEPSYISALATPTGGETIAIGTGGSADDAIFHIVRLAETSTQTELVV